MIFTRRIDGGCSLHTRDDMPGYGVLQVIESLFIPVKLRQPNVLEPFYPIAGTIRYLPSLDTAWEYVSEIDD